MSQFNSKKKKNFAMQLSPSQTLKANNFCVRGKKKSFYFFFFCRFFLCYLDQKKTKDKRQKKKKMCQLRVFSRKKERRGEKGTKLGLVLGLVLGLLNGVWVYNFSFKQTEESEKSEEDKVWLRCAIISTAG